MTSMIRPAALAPGDLVKIVAPASNLKRDYLERGIAELERLGFRSKVDAGILELDRYTAGSDARRAGELNKAFADPEVKAVWAARGGYGSMRLLSLLDQDLLRANPKIVIGYSDITALHLFLYKRFDWVTFHGPMAAKDLAAGAQGYDSASLLAALCSSDAPWCIGSTPMQILHRGSSASVSGRLIGGCLSIISAMMGTPDEIDTRGSILFLEDTSTRPFAIDRMLMQLRLAGKLSDVRAIVFGEMLDCEQHPKQGYRLEDVLSSCTADLGVPVLFGLPSGHSPQGNLTLPLGVAASLDVEGGFLSIDEPAVSMTI
jgi:muramoyltetrapeptide carboxypeptidase